MLQIYEGKIRQKIIMNKKTAKFKNSRDKSIWGNFISEQSSRLVFCPASANDAFLKKGIIF
jgi:hypothetical protein